MHLVCFSFGSSSSLDSSLFVELTRLARSLGTSKHLCFLHRSPTYRRMVGNTATTMSRAAATTAAATATTAAAAAAAATLQQHRNNNDSNSYYYHCCCCCSYYYYYFFYYYYYYYFFYYYFYFFFFYYYYYYYYINNHHLRHHLNLKFQYLCQPQQQVWIESSMLSFVFVPDFADVTARIMVMLPSSCWWLLPWGKTILISVDCGVILSWRKPTCFFERFLQAYCRLVTKICREVRFCPTFEGRKKAPRIC